MHSYKRTGANRNEAIKNADEIEKNIIIETNSIFKAADKITLRSSIVKKIVSSYGLHYERYLLFSEGIENRSAIVYTKEGSFVLRIYKNGNKTEYQINAELEFMKFLQGKSLPVPKVFLHPTKKSIYTYNDGETSWRCILMDYINGNHITPKRRTLIPKLAKLQANLHKESANFILKQNTLFSDFEQIYRTFLGQYFGAKDYIITKKIGGDITNSINRLIEEIDNNMAEIKKLPSGVVHLDLHGSNVLIKDYNISAIIDFDDLSYCPFVVDLANSLLWWLYNNMGKREISLYDEYLSEYQIIRKLSLAELKVIRLFMRLRNFTVKINPFYLKKVKNKEWVRALAVDKLLLDR